MEKKTKREILEKLAGKVEYYLPLTYNCAQTSFAALRDVFRLEDGGIFRALTPFPALAGRGETCGAVTGCLVVVGLAYGLKEDDIGKANVEHSAWKKARIFCSQFAKEYTSTQCSDILMHILGSSSPESREERSAWVKRRDAKCMVLVQDAVRLTAEFLIRDPSFSE
jgi:C_GCAxxG_C_C family probable redox protein